MLRFGRNECRDVPDGPIFFDPFEEGAAGAGFRTQVFV